MNCSNKEGETIKLNCCCGYPQKECTHGTDIGCKTPKGPNIFKVIPEELMKINVFDAKIVKPKICNCETTIKTICDCGK